MILLEDIISTDHLTQEEYNAYVFVKKYNGNVEPLIKRIHLSFHGSEINSYGYPYAPDKKIYYYGYHQSNYAHSANLFIPGQGESTQITTLRMPALFNRIQSNSFRPLIFDGVMFDFSGH